MIHARPDYNRIQDPDGRIPQDEPVFLLRAQDKTAAQVVAIWALMQPEGTLKETAEKHANRMGNWKRQKWADITPGQRNEVHGPAPVGAARDYVAEIAELNRQLATSRAAADRVTASERETVELILQIASANAKRIEAEGASEAARSGADELGRALDAERKARAEAEALAASRQRTVERLGDKCEVLHRSALIAGCIEVCGVCGKPAPCKNYSDHYEAKMRWVNKRAEDAIRERALSVMESGRLGTELSSEQRHHQRFMAAFDTLKREFDTLKRQLSQSGHDMDTAGQCDAGCPACEKIRELARAETADALDHLQTCPPNMCRGGHAEIRYEQAEDTLGCPLCQVLSKLASWEKKMPCGHPEAALIVDDPPHCAVCDQVPEIAGLAAALRMAKIAFGMFGCNCGNCRRCKARVAIDAALAPHNSPPEPRYEGGTHADR